MSSISRIRRLEDKLKPPDGSKFIVRVCWCSAPDGEDHDPKCPASDFNGLEGVIRVSFDDHDERIDER